MPVSKMTFQAKKAWLGNGLVMPGPKRRPSSEAPPALADKLLEGPVQPSSDPQSASPEELEK